MKYRENLLEQLKPLSYFTKATVYSLSKRNDMKEKTVDVYLSRYLKSKDIISLKKRGTYVTRDYYEKNRGNPSYKFYLANILKEPSYISSWTALQYYDLTTDVINTVISVTPKTTQTYDTKIGSFAYHSIKKELFTDFAQIKGTFDFFIASPSKALFDLLYINTNQMRGISLEMIDDIVDGFRIDLDEMDEGEKKKFYRLIKNHLT